MDTQQQQQVVPQRITVIIRDQLGSPYAIVAITKEVVLEASYIIPTGILQLVLASTHTEGRSSLQWTDKTTGHKQGEQIVQKRTGALRQDMYYELEGQHNMLNIGDEDEIRKVWDFLECDLPAEELFRLRAEGLQKLAEFKKQKQEEAEEKLRKALADKEAADNGELQPAPSIVPLTDDEKKLIKAIKSGKAGVAIKG